jgi:hypothetical protein
MRNLIRDVVLYLVTSITLSAPDDASLEKQANSKKKNHAKIAKLSRQAHQNINPLVKRSRLKGRIFLASPQAIPF